MKRSARMAAFLLAAALSAAPCLAEFTPVEVPQATNAPAAPEAMENVPQITEKGLTLGNNSVKYPEITGMADESIQQQVNDAILQAGKIENRLSRMAVLISSPVPLTVTYSAALADDVLSVAILSSGALETERATQEWAAVNIDLRTGQEITFGDLFTDEDEARAKMEETIADEILPDMSAHHLDDLQIFCLGFLCFQRLELFLILCDLLADLCNLLVNALNFVLCHRLSLLLKNLCYQFIRP